MGRPFKSPQLKGDLLHLTPVEMLGEIFCGSVYIYSAEKLTTWGADCGWQNLSIGILRPLLALNQPHCKKTYFDYSAIDGFL